MDPIEDENGRISPQAARQIVANGELLLQLFSHHWSQPPPVSNAPERLCQGLLGRSSHTFQSLLTIQKRGPDCAVLVRVLYEYVVAFAWVAINPIEHYPMFLRWELDERNKLLTDLAQFSEVAIDLDAPKRAMMDAGRVAAPSTLDRALQADNYWGRMQNHWDFHFRANYPRVFRGYSPYVHPTTTGVENGAEPLWALPAVHTFADALVVWGLRFGSPSTSAVARAFAHGLVSEEGNDQ